MQFLYNIDTEFLGYLGFRILLGSPLTNAEYQHIQPIDILCLKSHNNLVYFLFLFVSKMLLPIFIYLTVVGNVPILLSKHYLVFSFEHLEFFDRIQC